MSSDYSEFKAEIKTVDSQDSLTGGVIVLVTGSLSSKSNGKRNFVQSFFLAPQEKGYFVLNDIFRYLDEESPETKAAAASLPNGVAEPVPMLHAAPEPGEFLNPYQSGRVTSVIVENFHTYMSIFFLE